MKCKSLENNSNNVQLNLMEIEGTGVGVSGFEYKSNRLKFLRKVFGILGCQAGLIIGLTTGSLFQPHINHLILQEDNSPLKSTLLVLSIILSSIILIAFVLRNPISLIIPLNFFLLALFTVFMGSPLALLAAYTRTNVLLYIEVMILAVWIGFFVATFLKSWEFDLLGGGICILIPIGITTFISYLIVPLEEFKFQCLPAAGFSIILCIYVVCVINLGMSPGLMLLLPDEYILSVVCVYSFIPGLFISFLILIWLVIQDMLNYERSSSNYFSPIVRFWEKDFWLYKLFAK